MGIGGIRSLLSCIDVTINQSFIRDIQTFKHNMYKTLNVILSLT